MTLPWRAGDATGIGSLPGERSRDAARAVVDALPDFLHVPELPSRGPGADLIGRTGALLHAVGADFGLETTPDGWRITAGVSRIMRRAISWCGEDLDAIEEFGQGYVGPIKTQVAGPWTLAAAIELPSGERMLRDPGACRDLSEALAEAVRLHLGDLQRRFPDATTVLQVDEPGLRAVLEGSIGSASGLSRLEPIDVQVVRTALGRVLSAAPGTVSGVHCCAQDPPIRTMVEAGAGFVSIDLTLGRVDEDALGEAWEQGVGIWAGTVDPIAVTSRVSDAVASAPLRELAHHLGFEALEHMAAVVITPTCGCAGASWAQVRGAYDACVRAGRVLRHEERYA